MKQRYILFRRGEVYYCEDTTTRKQTSLQTKCKSEAQTLIHAKNEAHRQPSLNLQIARAYLGAIAPSVTTRTWQTPMDEITKSKIGPTQERCHRAMQDKAFDTIRNVPILETTAAHFLKVLETGGVATNVFLRRIHNFALDMNWLPWPVLSKKQWPKVRFKEKRAITLKEHTAIINREKNVEHRAFYELCWHLGGSQTDIANLRAEDIDWEQQVVSFSRKKTGTVSTIHMGDQLKSILLALPRVGFLFPTLQKQHERHRASTFKRRCTWLGITGVSLHSYRYSWAERAKSCGYPERFAQSALGHNSKSVHRAYSKKAQVRLPSLETYEENSQKIVPLQFQNVHRTL